MHPNEAIPWPPAWSGFAWRRPSFRSCEKKAKARRGLGAEELQAPRTRFCSKRLHPRTPVFTGAQDRVMHRPLSGAEVSRHTLLLIPAAAPLAVMETCRAFGTRLVTAWVWPGAPPWAAGASSFAGASGSGKRCFVCSDFVRRSIGRRTEGPVSAFLWRSDTVSLPSAKPS